MDAFLPNTGFMSRWMKLRSDSANLDRMDVANLDNDTSYVYASTVGDTDLYDLPGLLGIGTYAQQRSTNPIAGPSGIEAEVNGLQAGVESASVASSDYDLRVTQVYFTVKVGDEAVYAYDAAGMNQLTWRADNGVVTTFSYDAKGNLLQRESTPGDTWDYSWSHENLLTMAKVNGARVQAYQYDALGRRVRVEGSSSSTWTVSLFSGQDIMYEVDQAGTKTKYVRANGMLLAKVNPDGSIRYYLGDHLGSTRQVRDASRNLVFSAEYEPFGSAYSTSGSEAFRFTGERHDDPTDLIHLRARQYDPEVGRFISADPVLGELSWPQTLNR